jgi:hypothetical protein
VNEAAGPRRDPVGPSRGTAIAQAYYYVIAAIGLIFVLGGTIAALIALRKWILPASSDPSEFFGPPDENDAARSFLGALAFAIPGALVLVWHLREARRREDRLGPPGPWGSILYLHLVAAISLLIALGGTVALGHALRDSVVPLCYAASFGSGPLIPEDALGESFDEEGSPIPPPELLPGLDPEVLRSEECYPSSSEALRSALDAGIVAAVAAAVWLWHLRRARRDPRPSPSVEEPHS